MRTDIRLHNAARDGPACIEIKVLEKGRSVPDLENALEHKLVGRHLRDHRSRYGILLLFRTGRRKRWQPADSAPLDLAGLVDRLTARTAGLVRRIRGAIDRTLSPASCAAPCRRKMPF